MADRATRKTWLERVAIALTNAVVAEKGKLAAIDTGTGLLTKGGVSTTLVPIGYFDESATGDGAALVAVRLFQGVWVHWFDNDSGVPVVAADLLSDVFILDDTTVSGLGTGRSVAGRVWALNTVDGVAVEVVGMNAG